MESTTMSAPASGPQAGSGPPGDCAQAPLAPLHADGRLRRRAPDPDHHPRRGRLRLRRARQPLPRRPLRPLLLQRGPRPRRDRRGDGAPGPRARLRHQLELRAPARDRAGGANREPHARRPQPSLLHLGRLRSGRVGAQARAELLADPGPGPKAQDHRPRGRLPRDDDGRAHGDRAHRPAHALRAVRPGRLPRPEHELLSLARGARPALGRGQDRRADRVRGRRHGRGGDPRAASERGRLHPAAGGLLPARAGDLRRERRAAHLGRGDLRLGPARATTSAASATATSRTSSPRPRRSPRPTSRWGR